MIVTRLVQIPPLGPDSRPPDIHALTIEAMQEVELENGGAVRFHWSSLHTHPSSMTLRLVYCDGRREPVVATTP